MAGGAHVSEPPCPPDSGGEDPAHEASTVLVPSPQDSLLSAGWESGRSPSVGPGWIWTWTPALWV